MDVVVPGTSSPTQLTVKSHQWDASHKLSNTGLVESRMATDT
jgi:hypothetical protein